MVKKAAYKTKHMSTYFLIYNPDFPESTRREGSSRQVATWKTIYIQNLPKEQIEKYIFRTVEIYMWCLMHYIDMISAL